jgi:hypothetical protein
VQFAGRDVLSHIAPPNHSSTSTYVGTVPLPLTVLALP